MLEHFDVAIVGGGIVGRTLAAALSRYAGSQRLKVAVIDSSAESPALPAHRSDLGDYCNRTSFITWKNYCFLQGLAGEDATSARILDEASWPVRQMRVWDRDWVRSTIQLDASREDGLLGRIVENRAIFTALSHQNGNCKWFSGERIEKIRVEPDVAVLDFSGSDKSITCSCIIGADGKGSIARKHQKPVTIEKSYEQKGIVATLRISNHETGNQVAFQRFLKSGPIALLPIGPDVVSMVWTLPTMVADRLMSSSMDADQWKRLIAAATRLLSLDVHYYLENPSRLTAEEFNWRYGSVDDRDFCNTILYVEQVSLDSLAVFPLSMYRARTTVAPRSILIGDAAHVIHPLAGQGVNLGIADARDLARTISEGADMGIDLGQAELYKRYQLRRHIATMGMSGFVEGVHRIYHHPTTASSHLRRVGMGILNNVTPLKSLIKNLFIT